jgi:1-deoxy-D-xylulose-5-phosphate synthase
LAGGFGAAIVETLNDHDVLVPVHRIGIPDVLVDHASPAQSKHALGLTPAQMSDGILKRFSSLRRMPVGV